MATYREASLPTGKFVDPTPAPAGSAHPEVGATSAPLKSASFFIGSYCKDYNEDFMLCKDENSDPAHCLKEGRKVTRCAMDLITKLRENCEKEWEAHYKCLEKHNQEYYACRKPERTLNECVFSKLKLEKVIPGASNTPIHLRENTIYN
ncbi:hypothetical protein BG000_011512 [Podila horticola]|nr:hypothetical protein BG003_000294 [Podila horticola]KAG0342938.1 hypothetical protein BG000_011512 [Podila horticola]